MSVSLSVSMPIESGGLTGTPAMPNEDLGRMEVMMKYSQDSSTEQQMRQGRNV